MIRHRDIYLLPKNSTFTHDPVWCVQTAAVSTCRLYGGQAAVLGVFSEQRPPILPCLCEKRRKFLEWVGVERVWSRKAGTRTGRCSCNC